MIFTFRKNPQPLLAPAINNTLVKKVSIKKTLVKQICMHDIMTSKNTRCSSCGH